MARTSKLSAIAVKQAKGRAVLHDGGGLYLRVSATGAKSWVYRYQVSGKRCDMGLGSASLFSLAEARKRAHEARKLVAEGLDPIEARLAERQAKAIDAAKAMTFQACAEAYIAAHRAGWRSPKSLQQWEGSLRDYVHGIFGALPVHAVDVGLVLKAIEPIWTEKPETANRVRGRIEAILDWATARRLRQGENPARWRGHLENLLPKHSKILRVEHFSALPYCEIGPFMTELRQDSGVAALALEFAILTAARTSEVIGARWDEFNLAERLWIVPGGRMKAGREHRVPLSDRTIALLQQMHAIRLNDFVFPGQRTGQPIGDTGLFHQLRRMGRDDLTAHGFRSSFRDWAAERTTFLAEVAEMALAHTVTGAVERAYRRGDLFDKRRQLMDAWARFCEAPVSGEVVALHATR